MLDAGWAQRVGQQHEGSHTRGAATTATFCAAVAISHMSRAAQSSYILLLCSSLYACSPVLLKTCTQTLPPSGSPECTPATPELVAKWGALFQPCLAYAVGLGFDIAFTPHLDDGLNNGQWRNAMLINPLQKYGGMSYFDFVIKPLADVMAATLQPNTKVCVARV